MITISDSDKINRCDAETAISDDNNDGESKCSCKPGYKKIDKKVGIRGHLCFIPENIGQILFLERNWQEYDWR